MGCDNVSWLIWFSRKVARRQGAGLQRGKVWAYNSVTVQLYYPATLLPCNMSTLGIVLFKDPFGKGIGFGNRIFRGPAIDQHTHDHRADGRIGTP